MADLMALRRRILMDTGRLPPIYRPVDYLEADGRQYINTEHIPTTVFRIEMDYMSYKSAGDSFQCLWGSQNGTGSTAVRYMCYISGVNDVAKVLIPTADRNLERDINFPSATYVNGLVHWIFDYATAQYSADSYSSDTTAVAKRDGAVSAYILARNSSGTAEALSKGRLYGARITDGAYRSILVPAVRLRDSKPGLCDMVTRAFFTNQGTGEFGIPT